MLAFENSITLLRLCERENMSISGIQGLPLEVTVVGCVNLKDTEWISRQDPYICLEYASSKFRTKTCTDGGRNPIFQEKFVLTLIEGLRELNVMVWNSNTLSADDFIGSGRIQLHKVLSQGYDDTAWPIQDKRGRYSGEVRLISYCSATHQPKPKDKPLALPGGILNPSMPGILPYVQTTAAPYPTPSPYAAALAYPPASTTYPPSAYPPPPTYSAYPPTSRTYPPPPAYPPPPTGFPALAPAGYPPQYPPPASSCYPPGPTAGVYPPPPY